MINRSLLVSFLETLFYLCICNTKANANHVLIFDRQPGDPRLHLLHLPRHAGRTVRTDSKNLPQTPGAGGKEGRDADGSGSALVANWIKEKLSSAEKLPYKIIYHFVGCGGSLGSEWQVVKTLCEEIRDRYGFKPDGETEDEKALDNLLHRVSSVGDKPLLLVLDGINQIVGSENVKRLNWLPVPPRNVKMLFTTLEDGETMQVFKERRYPVFTIQHLTREERIRMIEEYLYEGYRKKLLPARWTRCRTS